MNELINEMNYLEAEGRGGWAWSPPAKPREISLGGGGAAEERVRRRGGSSSGATGRRPGAGAWSVLALALGGAGNCARAPTDVGIGMVTRRPRTAKRGWRLRVWREREGEHGSGGGENTTQSTSHSSLLFSFFASFPSSPSLL